MASLTLSVPVSHLSHVTRHHHSSVTGLTFTITTHVTRNKVGKKENRSTYVSRYLRLVKTPCARLPPVVGFSTSPHHMASPWRRLSITSNTLLGFNRSNSVPSALCCFELLFNILTELVTSAQSAFFAIINAFTTCNNLQQLSRSRQLTETWRRRNLRQICDCFSPAAPDIGNLATDNKRCYQSNAHNKRRSCHLYYKPKL